MGLSYVSELFNSTNIKQHLLESSRKMLRRDLHIGSNNLPFLDQCGPYSPWQQQVKIRTMGLLFRYRIAVEKEMWIAQQ